MRVEDGAVAMPQIDRAANEIYNRAAFRETGCMTASPVVLTKPFRTVLRWQVIATAILVFAGGILAGPHGALSSALGGTVSVFAYGASALVASNARARSAAGILSWALLAEAIKIGLIIVLLWLVLATYERVVMLAFFGSFFATVLLFFKALLVRDYD